MTFKRIYKNPPFKDEIQSKILILSKKTFQKRVFNP